MKTENGSDANKKFRPAAFLTALLTLLVYLPATRNGFVNWDDATYVVGNRAIRTFNLTFLKWSFTTHLVNNWHPLTIISYALDYQLLGLNPFIYHLTNIVLHAANTFLVAILSFRLINRAGEDSNEGPASIREVSFRVSLITALLFGLHPLHVESVVWVSERKDVLYALFYLLSVLSYIGYVSANSKRSNYRYYIAAIFFFLLSLMSKPMAISLPLILLLLDYYPLRRLTKDSIGLGRAGARVFLEKIPFFILSALTGVLTIWAQGKAVAPLKKMPFMMRIFVAIRAYIFYGYKIILPVNLAPLYPYPKVVFFFSYEYLGACVLFLLFAVLSIMAFKKYKFPLILFLYYFLTLLPVIGLVQVGAQAAADRYTYLASLGPFILMSVMIVWAAKRIGDGKSLKVLLTSIVAAMVLAMSFLTVRQETVWKDGIALWSHEIELYPAAYRAYVLRGLAYQGLYDNKRAVKDFGAAIALRPGEAMTYNNRGISYGGLGDYVDAIKDFNKAIELDPTFGKAYNNRGYTFLKTGDYDKAIKDLKRTLDLEPGNAGIYYSLGYAYSKTGDAGKAKFYFNKASALNGKNR